MKLLLVLALVLPTLGLPRMSRIHRGDEAKAGQFPYQVSIEIEIDDDEFYHACGGSIVDEYTILTAGRCIFNPRNLYVTVGSHDLLNEGLHQRLKVDRAIKNPNYTMGYDKDQNHDIGVLKLESPIIFNEYVQPVTLATVEYDYTGRNCTVSGYASENEGDTPSILRYVEVGVMLFSKCKRLLELQAFNLLPSSVCSKHMGFLYYGPGSRDIGGPYACPDENGKMTQIGIVSRVPKEKFMNWPVVYTEVSAYRDWISLQ